MCCVRVRFVTHAFVVQCKAKIVSEVTVSVSNLNHRSCPAMAAGCVCVCVKRAQVRERLMHCFTELMKEVEQNLEARNR